MFSEMETLEYYTLPCNSSVGDYGVIGGDIYTIKDKFQLAADIEVGNDVTKSVTTYITDMSYMCNIGAFNQDISSWDVSKVTDMNHMFNGASSFNQDLSSWDVNNVTDMAYMFSGASAFNQNISSWGVSRVTNMEAMFMLASSFNQDLSSWDVSDVADCEYFSSLASAWTKPKPNFTNCNPG